MKIEKIGPAMTEFDTAEQNLQYSLFNFHFSMESTLDAIERKPRFEGNFTAFSPHLDSGSSQT